ncbi:MAG: hypothetical protein HOE80_00800 [Candidatus Magasanikbacteria bacterium]|jgi:hypothetical protein|nr:hypothetical protein [Candidatus Magasanikbacteria bacterium]MBT4071245.1 hypothetical protein [Candidatus Magasanikbacteria bacterium]
MGEVIEKIFPTQEYIKNKERSYLGRRIYGIAIDSMMSFVEKNNDKINVIHINIIRSVRKEIKTGVREYIDISNGFVLENELEKIKQILKIRVKQGLLREIHPKGNHVSMGQEIDELVESYLDIFEEAYLKEEKETEKVITENNIITPIKKNQS